MPSFKIGDRVVGDGGKTFIIAEGGINHQGDVNIAKELILLAKKSGSDMVKFQKRTIEANFTKSALARPYTDPTRSFGPTYGEHKLALELSESSWREMMEYAKEIGILCTGSAMDEGSVDLLMRVGAPCLKIGSGDFYNLPLLRYAAKQGVPVLMSTGMADSLESVVKAYKVVREHTSQVCVFHCTSTYPLPIEDVHLNCIPAYKAAMPDAVIGYSGHETGTSITLAAVALGAQVVERHVTLNKSWKGGDHKASLDPTETHTLVQEIRLVERALGTATKARRDSEIPVYKKCGKSVVARKAIPAGTVLTADHLAVKVCDPHGVVPMHWDKVIGTKTKSAVGEDEPVTNAVLGWK